MQLRYGPGVEIEYIDLADPQNQVAYSRWIELVEEQRLPYPLVVLDDRLRHVGSVHYHEVLPLVEEALAGQEGDAGRSDL